MGGQAPEHKIRMASHVQDYLSGDQGHGFKVMEETDGNESATFKANFEQYEQAAPTIEKCEAVLSLYDSVVGAAKIPLAIQNAVNARRADGSNLEYGLEHHLDRFKGALEKGVPTDKRFPERSNKYITDMAGWQEALLTWLEGFKAKFEKYQQAAATIDECETVLSLHDSVVGACRQAYRSGLSHACLGPGAPHRQAGQAP